MTAHDPAPHDASSDDDIESLLQHAFEGEPISDEFASTLSDQLESEFQSVSPVTPAHSATDAYNSTASDPMRPAGHRTWRRISRSLFALTTLGLVIAAVVWTSESSYSWASMLDAIESQAVVELSSGDLLHQQTDHGSTSSLEQRLIAFLMRTAGEQNFDSDDDAALSDSISVLSQSWRSVGDGENRQIQLDVFLSVSSSEVTPIHLVMTLDPDTHLPLQCRIVGQDAQVASTVQFSYPVAGMTTVADTRPSVSGDLATASSEEVRVAAVESPDSAVPGNPVTAERSAVAEDIKDLIAPDPAAPNHAASASTADLRALAPVTPIALSSTEMTHRMDEIMISFWEKRGVSPVELSTDDEFFRRVYLDLTGRIPGVSEYREFQADDPNHRRQRLINQLLARRDHATHLAAVWRNILLPDGVDLNPYGGAAGFEEWLSDRFRDNVGWDEVVTELLLAEGRVSEPGPILFYTALKLEPEKLAAQTARAFLGMRLECAQCHDHFFDHRLKQTDFWGYAAFFAQISRPEGKMDTVSPVLRVADTNRGDVTLPETTDVIQPRYLLGEVLSQEPQSPPRRHQLAEWMTATENPHFARATVNRVWAHLFGRGLVEPVDDMRSDNPPVCPEVLEELAGFFVASGFDLRELFRVIVSSDTYQRTSRSSVDDPERTSSFAQMNIKAFTAEQLYDSIAVATQPEALSADDGSLMRSQNFDRQSFLTQFRTPPGQVTDYQSGIPQALMLMNGGLIQSATDLQSSGVLRSLQAPFFSDEQRIDILFLATLSRHPDDVERQAMLDYVLAADNDRSQRLRDILWALLNSAEFTLNH